MIGIVICTHAALSEALLTAAEMIVGPYENTVAVSVNPGEGPDTILERLQAASAEANSGMGVMILCDMFGGTPSNMSLSLLGEDVEIVTGVNLPMLIKLSTIRDRSLAEVATTIQEHGRRNILVAGAVLRGEDKGS